MSRQITRYTPDEPCTDDPSGRRARGGVEVTGVAGVAGVAQGERREAEAALQTAIEELGYRPNAAARSLTERRTRIVGVLLNDLRNPWFVDCLDGLGAELHGSGLRMFMADSCLDRRMGDNLTEVSGNCGSTGWSSSVR